MTYIDKKIRILNDFSSGSSSINIPIEYFKSQKGDFSFFFETLDSEINFLNLANQEKSISKENLSEILILFSKTIHRFSPIEVKEEELRYIVEAYNESGITFEEVTSLLSNIISSNSNNETLTEVFGDVLGQISEDKSSPVYFIQWKP